MKKYLIISALLSVSLAGIVFAATYRVKSGDTWESIAAKNGVSVQALIDLNQPSVGNRINVPVSPAPSPVPPPVSGEIRFQAYTTGYSNFDNTPKGSSQTDLGGHSGNTGGTGTYADPITLAVGGSIINGKEIDDFAYGTKFYVPNLRKYFSARDFCGDGNTPQNGPCHTGYQNHTWIDLFIGGPNTSVVLSCEDNITNVHLVIQNPAQNYLVVPGAVYDTGCKQYGDTVLTQ